MKRHWIVAASALAALAAGGPVHACYTSAPLELEDVRYAEIVVVGRIANYRIVEDPVARREHQRWLAASRRKRSAGRAADEAQTGFLSDYARFDVLVQQVLLGRAGARIAVTWDNSTYGEPESLPPGPYLIALRRSRSALPPMRTGSATILPSPGSLTVLQAPCADAFIFEGASERAAAVRKIIAKGQKRPRPQ